MSFTLVLMNHQQNVKKLKIIWEIIIYIAINGHFVKISYDKKIF